MLREQPGTVRDIRTVSAGVADGVKLYLTGLKKKDGTNLYSPSTLHKQIEAAKRFFKAALRDRVINTNPFEDVTASKHTNANREYFVTREEIQKCIDATPDAQWKLIMALSRFGRLRTPSEHARLRWQDILWDQNRMVVHAPKTEDHGGMASRIVPLYPEFRLLLEAVLRQKQSGRSS